MNRKIISILIIDILIATVFSSCFSVGATFSEIKNIKNADIKNKSAQISDGDDIDRWAVIIGVGDYLHDNIADLGCDKEAKDLYELLQEKDGRWTTDNTHIIVNKNATKQDILDTLDWLAEKADEDDIVMFSFFGHGTFIKDENGDERDRFDEAICPYDFHYDEVTGESTNVITDDELSDKFDAISEKNIEGMFLIFDSCLSGGLVDGREKKSERSLTFWKLINTVKKFKETNNFILGLTEDVSTSNKVILTASTPHGISWNIFATGVIEAIENGKTTAEDISKYAKKWYIDETFLESIHDFPLSLILMIIFILKYGYPLMCAPYIPLVKDGYPADSPSSAELTIIDDDNNQSQSS